MAGRISVDEAPAPNHWDRFVLEFADGGRLALRDKRRLGRAVIEPDFSHVGPGRRRGRAATCSARASAAGSVAAEGASCSTRARSPASATCSPTRRCGAPGSPRAGWPASCRAEELDRLRRELRAATRDAIREGGVHTGRFVRARGRGGALPALRHGRSSATRSAGAPRTGARSARPSAPRTGRPRGAARRPASTKRRVWRPTVDRGAGRAGARPAALRFLTSHQRSSRSSSPPRNAASRSASPRRPGAGRG